MGPDTSLDEDMALALALADAEEDDLKRAGAGGKGNGKGKPPLRRASASAASSAAAAAAASGSPAASRLRRASVRTEAAYGADKRDAAKEKVNTRERGGITSGLMTQSSEDPLPFPRYLFGPSSPTSLVKVQIKCCISIFPSIS